MQANSLAEKSFVHIFNVVNYLPVNEQWNKLKQRYVSQYNKNEGKLAISKETERSLTHCPSCFVAFNENTKLVKVVPENKKRFRRRLLKKAEDSKPLTKYQAKYLKKADKHLGNTLIIKCLICKKEIKKNLTKPAKKIVPKEEIVQEVVKTKKKKKKKDKFSGLNQRAVLSVADKGKLQEENKNSSQKVVNKTPTQENDNKTPLPVVDNKKQSRVNKAVSIKNKLQQKKIDKKKEIATKKKQEGKTNKILSKLNTTLNKSSSAAKSDLSKFLSSL